MSEAGAVACVAQGIGLDDQELQATTCETNVPENASRTTACCTRHCAGSPYHSGTAARLAGRHARIVSRKKRLLVRILVNRRDLEANVLRRGGGRDGRGPLGGSGGQGRGLPIGGRRS